MEFIKHFISSNDAEIDVSQIGEGQRFTFEYGDIVEVVSPSNNELHEMTFYINYIDSQENPASECSYWGVSRPQYYRRWFF